MAIHAQSLVADIVLEEPAAWRVFHRHGIDFCCGGQKPLDEACAEQQVSIHQVLDEIRALERSDDDESINWEGRSLSDLMDYILQRYHTRLREVLPRLDELIGAVQQAHAEAHGEMLSTLRATYQELKGELDSHMMKEETVLFPFIRDMEVVVAESQAISPTWPDSIAPPIDQMEEDHRSAADALVRIRERTNVYTPPADACTSFEALLSGLSDLEEDLHLHIHLENNILFPRAILLAQGTVGV